MKRKRKYFLFFAVILSSIEVLLRFVNFRFEPNAEFGYPHPADFSELRYHPELFWTLNPSEIGVNSWGFPGEEIVTPKPKDVFRLLFLGDSIMQAGYPRWVESCLREAGFQNIEAVTLAVNGYSSYQGRVLADNFGLLLEPDLVILQFGWNDQWLAYGDPDVEKVFPRPHPVSITFHKVYDRVRILQGLAWLWAGLTKYPVNQRITEVRVPQDDYRENLRHIQQIFEDNNIPVYFVTAPSTHSAFGVPEEIIAGGFAVDSESVTSLNQTYNQIVREGTPKEKLVDFARDFSSASLDELDKWFNDDGFHPTELGSIEMGQRICEIILPAMPTSTE
jgi:lysophospholipase L1-like esterase